MHLHVVTSYFNPAKYKSRHRLFIDFEKYIKCSGATLWTIELAIRDHDFEVTEPNNPQHIQLRSQTTLWHKERLLNLAINRLPKESDYIAWIDADVSFANSNWVNDALHLLQHYKVIQLFSQAIDLTPKHEFLNKHTGVVAGYLAGMKFHFNKYCNLHPGFGWAFRREALDELGGLLDTAILGAGDKHMAFSMLGGQAVDSMPPDINEGYKNSVLEWQNRALKFVNNKVGFLDGLVFHNWHGKKRDRRYLDRWQILTKHQFNPDTDLKNDSWGVWQFEGNKPALELDVLHYFLKMRNEDSIDL